MAYKRELISTNQPIQLLDNSKYSETVDSNGRINVSQPLKRSDKEVTWLVQSNIPVVKNHKYYAASNYFSVNMEGNFTAYIAFDNGEFSTPSIVDGISTCLATGLVSFYLKYSRSRGIGGVTVEATAGPQLFDLTATFGAGNEPSTVAEFKTKYPNELYDYRTSNCLSSYKKLLKVSDVCQLLDKSKYPATMTTNGVTFTNNGDGTITVNGTTSSVRANYFVNTVPAAEGHIYLLTGVAGNSSKFFLNSFFISNTSWLKDNVLYAGNEAIIFPYVAGATKIRTHIAINPNATANNLVFKPQLFDLTEMYGAGNEPATVAEFKAKFPNELYDYSPRCWVTSYKTGLIAKTKNLFNLATASVGYIQWEGILNHEEDTVTYPLSSDYLECTPNTSYTISAFCGKHPITKGSTLWCRIAYYDENKQILTRSAKSSTDTNIDYISLTASAPTNAKYLRACTRWMSPTYKEQHPENWVMLEKGSTATDYVPYGYL